MAHDMTDSNRSAAVQALMLGGGPAGSAAAVTLASAGVDTLLVDKSAFKRQKLCGGLLTLRSQRRNEQVFSQPWEGALGKRRHGLRLLHDNQLLNAVDNEQPLCFSQLRHFDHYLLQQAAERGARLQLGDGVQSIDLGLRVCKLRSGARIDYDHLIGGAAAPVLPGADGKTLSVPAARQQHPDATAHGPAGWRRRKPCLHPARGAAPGARTDTPGAPLTPSSP